MEDKANKAWTDLIQEYQIDNAIKQHGEFIIQAKDIKKYREPRLMAKWDSSESLPTILKKSDINILPVSRSAYVLSNFKLYQPFPENDINTVKYVPPLPLESIDFNNLSTESNAINAMLITGILDDFLGTNNTVETFNGRMGTNDFSFTVNLTNGGKRQVDVQSAQLEIDGGFENDDSIIIMEAKNVPHPDFHIRQLYFPYRLWCERVRKPIRLVFSQYIDSIYHLYEYEFANEDDYSSIHLIQQRNYSFQSSAISWDDIQRIIDSNSPEIDDNYDDTSIPFIQADLFTRLISLIEQLDKVPNMTSAEIASSMEFDIRQASYYSSAGEYLGVIERPLRGHSQLSLTGIKLMRLKLRERRLELIKLIVRHNIFHDLLSQIIDTGEFPSREAIIDRMRRYNVCKDATTLYRRASSVSGWLRWIVTLPDTTEEFE